MRAELIYDGGDHVKLPSTWRRPNPDQFQGTVAEQLVEAAGRCCYDSAGLPTSRASIPFHRNLAGLDGTPPHYSVHEHVHVTIETDDFPLIWVGIPDVSVAHELGGDLSNPCWRVTFNLRHCLEWPKNVTYRGSMRVPWENMWVPPLLRTVQVKMPSIFPSDGKETYDVKIVEPKYDTEAFVSLFLEDSRVWSHEMVRHRFNISQRSGRFVDETDRENCTHPLLRDFIREEYDEHFMFDDQGFSVTMEDMQKNIKQWVEESLTKNDFVYAKVCNVLQAYATSKGLDRTTARKQARSAARYYLGNGLSTEMVFTASIRSWRGIFAQRCHPAADQAIRELMEAARELVKGSRYGHLL
jgi:Thymidylate synthase complementing protein